MIIMMVIMMIIMIIGLTWSSPVTNSMSYEDYSTRMHWLRGESAEGSLKPVFPDTWDYYDTPPPPSSLTDSLWSDVFRRSNGGAQPSSVWEDDGGGEAGGEAWSLGLPGSGSGEEENQHNWQSNDGDIGGSGSGSRPTFLSAKETQGGHEDPEGQAEEVFSSGIAISDHFSPGGDGGQDGNSSLQGLSRGGEGRAGGAGAYDSNSTTTTSTTKVMARSSSVVVRWQSG